MVPLMVTWYQTSAQTWTRDPGDLVGWSVRPDLWPAGTSAQALGGQRLSVYAGRSIMELLCTLARGAAPYSAPGAAEALILAGQVPASRLVTHPGPWELISAPKGCS